MEQITSVGMAGFANKHFVQPFFSKERPMFSIGADTFLGFVNEALAAETNLCRWVDSQQMPFCKYLFVPNFTSACPSHLKIENSNAQWLRSGYEARVEGELPVLVRWFDLPIKPDPADFLMCILYSREQLQLEIEAVDVSKVMSKPTHDWNIISIIALNEQVVPPMPPITAMRNSLGIEEGGNGIKIDRIEYQRSVDYWDKNAMVR